jgi:succinate-semialdehyde dehydrogenase / glutarate-semialdehyde dehydrogenase
MKAFNPATGELIREYAETPSEAVARMIDDSHIAFVKWRKIPIQDRATFLFAAADRLVGRKNEFAELMALEMGKPVREGIGECEKCAWVCRYYAEHAEEFLQPIPIETDASRSFVTYNPLGVVLAVMPWNFPFWQVFRAAAPILMAGNAMVLKHASNVPGCALAIESVFADARLPANVFRTLLIGSGAVREVLENPHVRAVTLTGAVASGRAVAGIAGSLLKKQVMELGGSDPFIVRADADIDEAAANAVTSRLINAGQSCIAAKRFIVLDSIYESFAQKVADRMRAAKMGDPFLPDTMVGPMARSDLRDELHDQVSRSAAMGAKILCGGQIPDGPGAYYPPTVLADVRKGMPAFDEEMFGPVAALIRAADDEEAIELANDTVFGLGAAIFTGDVPKGERIAAERLDAGCAFVNAFVRSDPRLPFGGVKDSGYGRELGSFGIREFVNIKTVYVR